jgi:hypothetical protein
LLLQQDAATTCSCFGSRSVSVLSCAPVKGAAIKATRAEATAHVKGAAMEAIQAKAAAPLKGAAMKADDVSPSLGKLLCPRLMRKRYTKAKATAPVKAAMKEAMKATDQEWKKKWVQNKLALVQKKAMKAIKAKAAADASQGKAMISMKAHRHGSCDWCTDNEATMEVTQGMTMSQAVCARCFTEFMKQKHADEAAAEVAKAQAEATAPVKGAATKAMKAKAGAPLEGAAMKADDVSPSLVKLLCPRLMRKRYTKAKAAAPVKSATMKAMRQKAAAPAKEVMSERARSMSEWYHNLTPAAQRALEDEEYYSSDEDSAMKRKGKAKKAMKA